jgi:hypothetical protein
LARTGAVSVAAGPPAEAVITDDAASKAFWLG